MSKVWKLTGTPENWLTAIRIGSWAINDYSGNIWAKINTGDTVIFHSIKNSNYTKKAIPCIIGFGYVGDGKYVKEDLWWPDEIASGKNIYKNVLPLKEIYLFSKSDIDFSMPVQDKEPDLVAKDIIKLLDGAIPIKTLNEMAFSINQTAPGFNVMGPPSSVHPVYEDLILKDRRDLTVLKNLENTEILNKKLAENIDDQLLNDPKDKVLEQAKVFDNSQEESHKIVFGERRIRKDNQVQKRRIAKIEDYGCQICGFKCSYVKANGKPGWVIEVDHIIDKARGGNENLNNLWVLCPNCHVKKTLGVIKIDIQNKKITENDEEIPLHHDSHLNW